MNISQPLCFPRRLAAVSVLGLLLSGLVMFPAAAVAQVNSIDVVVPRKAGAGQFQISQMELTVQIDTDSPIEFTVTTPALATDTTPSLSPGDPTMPSDTMLFGADLVRFYPPDSTLGTDDPRRRNYRILISPGSDYDSNSCLTTMAGDETWTFAVNGGALRIVNGCLISEDENTTANPACDDFLRVVPSTEPFAEIGGLSSQEQSCRFGLEGMLVLDRSGSMSSRARPAEPASASNQRIVSLRDAVTTFTTALTNVRAAETANGLTVPTDRLGVVIFNSNAGPLPLVPAGLNIFGASLASDITSDLAAGSVDPSGSTSIGDGLILGATSLGGATGDVRRVLLLMSDGRQNNDQRVSVIGDEIVTHSGATACPSGSASPGCSLLPNNGNYSVCAVTVGTGATVNAAINQQVALAGDCFYLNSEDDASEMSTFFLNVLQNFLATGSWQTLLAGADSATATEPVQITVPVTSTTLALAVTVAPRDNFVCLQVAAPGQPPGNPVCGSGPVNFRRSVAELSTGDMGGDWQILITAPESPRRPADFYTIVMADDVATHASADVLASEFAPLEPIRVRVRLDEHGTPITGLSGGLNLRLATPTLTIGELMATVNTDTSGASDPDSNAVNAAIDNAVAGNPTALLDDQTVIALAEVNPGIYEAQFSIEEYGHADLVLTLGGDAPRGGAFTRQISQTLYIRAVPDADETELTTQIDPGTGDSGSTMSIRLVPKTVSGHPVGPGLSNYYWLQGPGVAPFKLNDNLDGSYTRTISYSGAPPELTVHSMPDTVSISDDVPPANLPAPLDDSTALVTSVTPSPSTSPWSLGLHLGFTDPRGTAGNFFDGALGLGVSLDYRFNPNFAAELYLGRDDFDSKIGGVPDIDVTHLSLGGKYYFTPAPNRVYAGASVGSYDPSVGSSDTGYGLMLGATFDVWPKASLEVRAISHTVNTSGPDFEYYALLAGVRFRF